MPVKVYYPGKGRNHKSPVKNHQDTTRDSAIDEAVITLTKDAINQQDIPILAHLARQYGIPPRLRHQAWPLLIDSHPYLNSNIKSDGGPQEIPIKRIKGEINRYRKRHPRNNQFAWSLKELSQDEIERVYEIIEESIVTFLNNKGCEIPYESGLVHVALDLSEWVSPLTINDEKEKFEFSDIYEKLMIIILHNSSSTTFADRISLFLSAIRIQIPDLATFFNDEGVISYSGDDEWLIWWIKWYGAKSWKSSNCASSWDLLIGYRNDLSPSVENIKNSNGVTIPFTMDPFWNPKDEHFKPPDTCIQHIFLSVAILQAFKEELEELEQSEIREFLIYPPFIENMHSLIIEAGYLWRQWQVGEEEEEKEEKDDF